MSELPSGTSSGLPDSRLFEAEFAEAFTTLDPYWQTFPPLYGHPDKERVAQWARNAHAATTLVTGDADWQDSAAALAKTQEFLDTSFRQFEDPKPAEHYERIFAVPVRTNRHEATDNSSELMPFVPIFGSLYGPSADIRQRAIATLAPSVLDTYEHAENGGGAIVLTPIFEDMRIDLAHNSAGENMRLYQGIMRDVASFSRRLGARTMGLGAVLPSFTSYGKAIHEEGLVTTSGHGGTVHLIGETVRDVIASKAGMDIGVIGAAGSIGRASVNYIFNDVPSSTLHLYDIDEIGLKRSTNQNPHWGSRVTLAESVLGVLRNTDTIVVAITQPIDLDILDPEQQLDLRGKVIIDDSQPGSFDRAQVMARGGELRWVVGQDTSDDKVLQRASNWNYGETVGLHSRRDLWGCEVELAAVALSGVHLAINTAVTTEKALNVGRAIRDLKVTPAQSQSFGVLNNSTKA